MIISPFAQAYASYSENGMSVIPIHPKGKRPAFIDPATGAWVGLLDWSRFCNEKPSQELLEYWATMPESGIGACMGAASGLLAVDIDTEDKTLTKQFMGVLPRTPFVKIGRRGCNLLYRFNPLIPTRSFALDGERTKVIEFLSTGKQIVLPPSLHPDTGVQYRWQEPDFSFEFHPVEAAPEITLDVFEKCADIVGAKLKHIERILDGRRLPKSPPPIHADNVWNELCDRALADIHAWVPKLFPDHRLLGQNNYRINAVWRGGENYNLSIHPEGIHDWASDDTYTPISLVKTAFGVSAMEAYTILSNIIIPPEERAENQKLSENIIKSARENELARKTHASIALSTPVEVDIVTSRYGDAPTPPDGIFEAAPNLLGDVAAFIRNRSGTPLKELALASALPLLATCIGNRIATETNLRGNIYTLGLAASGTGKNDTLKIPIEIMNALGRPKTLIGTPASSAGLINAMNRNNGTSLWLQDEFGRFLKFINSPNSGNHEATVLTASMELYTSSESAVYYGREYAPSHSSNKSSNEGQRINNPFLSIYGASVPEHVFEALTSKDAVDGFAARWLVFHSDAKAAAPMFRRAVKNTVNTDISYIVDKLLEACSIVADKHNDLNRGSGSGNLSGVLMPLNPVVVPFTDDALEYLEGVVSPLITKKKELLEEIGLAHLQPVWNRAAAHISKVALLASDFNAIDVVTVKWAADLVVYLTEWTVFKLATSICDTPERKAAWDIYQAIGELVTMKRRWITRSELLKHRLLRRYEKKQVTNAIDLLLAMDVVECQEEKSGKRPTIVFRVIADFNG